MEPNPEYLSQPKNFWAYVRTLGEVIGYSKKGNIQQPSILQIASALEKRFLSVTPVIKNSEPTDLGKSLVSYFAFRSKILHEHAEPNLMNVDEAQNLFEDLQGRLNPSCPIPMNKQKGDKKAAAYFTAVINMLVEAHSDRLPCDYDPRQLTTFTRDGKAVRTLARRIDGCFPSVVNPVAVWEIKEYYYTTTFGSRVAGGVYETLLDGLELEEMASSERIEAKHYLMVDAYYTWWDCGKSYLCRMVDMLHMGLVDEVLFGREVVTRLPEIVPTWVATHRQSSNGQ